MPSNSQPDAGNGGSRRRKAKPGRRRRMGCACARAGEADNEAPHVDSPSIAGGWQGSADWPAGAKRSVRRGKLTLRRFPWLGRLRRQSPPSRAPSQGAVRPHHRLRRDGRVGAGTGDLARRNGAAAAANGRLLQTGRPRRQFARAALQGRQGLVRNGRGQVGTRDRGLDHRRIQQAGRNSAAALQRARRARRRNLRLEYRAGAIRSCGRARGPSSSRGLPRRRRTAAISTCASSTSETSPAAMPESDLRRLGFNVTRADRRR